ncbi:MAG: 3-oxoacyl-ACP reductase, partial [Micromonosporaceae bacterium]
QFANTHFGRRVAKQLGLPAPTPLRRHRPGEPDIAGPVLLGAAEGGRLGDSVAQTLMNADVKAHTEAADGVRYGALIFDATGIADSSQLRALYEFFHPVIRSVVSCGRVIVLGGVPEEAGDLREAAAQQGLEGFVKSVGKEIGRGSSANLVRVGRGAESGLDSTLRFLASARSAYVSGQAVHVTPGVVPDNLDVTRPLAGNTALVTGAARGIGAVIADVLAEYGAQVVCLDLTASGDDLSQVANRIGGSALQLDITSSEAPRTIADHLQSRYGGVDIVVHNAGITRDKTLAKMTEQQWASVIEVNLSSQERIDDTLLGEKVLNDRGRIVAVASISGIAGNAGQTNYATSKAAVAGRARALAPAMRKRNGTVNAVAPGFIETAMTAKIPLVIRQAGRLMNSMSQGGLPRDVAETVAWLADPASNGVNGNVVRVCGQSLLGA